MDGWEDFLSWVVVMIFMIGMLFGDNIANAFYAIINRPDRKRLSRKEEQELRKEVEAQRNTIAVAADIFRDVQAADAAFPQLPAESRKRIDEFMEVHRPRPQLPGSKK